jgi:hypothetical protein
MREEIAMNLASSLIAHEATMKSGEKGDAEDISLMADRVRSCLSRIASLSRERGFRTSTAIGDEQ